MGRHLYNFIWDDFCDWYIEMAKLPLYGEDEAAKKTTRSILAYVLDQTMRLLHPFMPFLTEEIWQHLPHEGESITVAAWPEVKPELSNEQASADMKLLVELIRSVRNIRSEVNTPMSKQVELYIKASTSDVQERLEKNRSYIERFTNPSVLEIGTDVPASDKAMTAVISGAELILPLEGLINLDEEIARLQKRA
ncbi:hypothetical protein BsIDN1_48640 [Bacillus safensis]|uniref:valine--tRNA ligase n=1 Tax=Bacillus safensis TaxID=561879 RepID=A0A5S9MHZ5_BACIA|nr:hypothetical protein BsIDN1_48640 [Bacillus safensis]